MTHTEAMLETWRRQSAAAQEDTEHRRELTNLGLLDGRWPVVVMGKGWDVFCAGPYLRIRHLGRHKSTAFAVARGRVKPFRGQTEAEFLAEQNARAEDWRDDQEAQTYPHLA